MTREIPEPWAKALKRAGLTDPRNGQPSMRALAEEVGVHTSTISDMMHGRRKSNVTTIERVAKALGVEATTVSKWAGAPRATILPYTPPAEANLLDTRQRKALDELIRAMTAKVGPHDTDDTVTPLSARSRPSATPETPPQKMRPLPVDYAADRGGSAGEEGWAEAQQLGEESQDDRD